MTDRRDSPLVIPELDRRPGASLVRMLVVGLVLIVLGMIVVAVIS
jgi:hypothetical protein